MFTVTFRITSICKSPKVWSGAYECMHPMAECPPPNLNNDRKLKDGWISNYWVISILPDATWPLRGKQDVHSFETRSGHQWGHQGSDVLGCEAVSWSRFLLPFPTADVSDLQACGAGKDAPATLDKQTPPIGQMSKHLQHQRLQFFEKSKESKNKAN